MQPVISNVIRKKENKEYGHMHLSVFYRKVLILGETGLIFKNKYYPWSSINQIDLWHQEWPGYGWVPNQKLLPRARVSLSDHKHFVLRGDALIKCGSSLDSRFQSAFDELLACLQEKYRGSMKAIIRVREQLFLILELIAP